MAAASMAAGETRRIGGIELVDFEIDIGQDETVRCEKISEFVTLVGAQRPVTEFAVHKDLHQGALAHQLVGVHVARV